MTDKVPVVRADDPGKARNRAGADSTGGATAPQIDPAALGTAFPRAHHVMRLQFGDHAVFDDPSRAGGGCSRSAQYLGARAGRRGRRLLHWKGQISLAAADVAPGLMVTAIILFISAVSGAHLN